MEKRKRKEKDPVYRFQPENGHKLGKIAHFSTMPVKTCHKPCKYCYAIKSVTQYKLTQRNYEFNQKMLDKTGNLPEVPKNRKVVRLYVSGDFHSIKTIKAWIKCAKQNPDVQFYGYTKQWQNSKRLPWLEKLRDLDNVILRASIDSQTGPGPVNWTYAGILEKDSIEKVSKYFVCRFNKDSVKCDTCKICFNKDFENVSIFFEQH